MSEPIEQLSQALKPAGHSLTAARKTVFMALHQQEPQSMRTLVETCRKTINRTSVYRTVALFEKLEIVQRLQIGWKYKIELSGAFHAHHHHMTCVSCGQTTAIAEDAELEKYLERVTQHASFVMRGHQLEIQGICNAC